jgi:uncharacterized protein YjiS (DUF1127 family)
MSLSYSLREPVRTASRVTNRKSLLASFMQWFARRRQWRDLRELDDRLLGDVGISPEQAFRSAGRPLGAENLIELEVATGPNQRS